MQSAATRKNSIELIIDQRHSFKPAAVSAIFSVNGGATDLKVGGQNICEQKNFRLTPTFGIGL